MKEIIELLDFIVSGGRSVQQQPERILIPIAIPVEEDEK
jgi:hypothetical protein